jgi:hypothetical protein
LLCKLSESVILAVVRKTKEQVMRHYSEVDRLGILTARRLCIMLKQIRKTFLIAFLFAPLFVRAEETRFEIGRLSFSLAPKILKDGSITDIGIGYKYGDNMSASLCLRYSAISKNEELENVKDSLNAVNEKIFDISLLPVQYYFFSVPEHELWLGGGLYYKLDILGEKGFFNMPALESLTPPRERVNSYNNDFTAHLAGPLLGFGYSLERTLYQAAFSGGITPLFFLHSAQRMSIVPLLDPQTAENSQNVFGSPYLYVSLDCVLFKYFNIAGRYELANMAYEVIDFDSDLDWILSRRNVTTHTLNLEGSLLWPLSETVKFQIGYGYLYNRINLNSGAGVSENRHYIILTAKKAGK